ncbi:hypothetical protein HNP38_002909 [Chryseobacterium defluvii]|uniref:WG repeat protein n=1 Tax=Chryseobacterium defluvii TaxID=160396 RepID=A0A840KJC1_9FLAO|nr:WG repeat-containing protein [Chryseobacterium defluvii]MBB4807603.1 hypothetical protein [Chryseobacterium defluvii]
MKNLLFIFLLINASLFSQNKKKHEILLPYRNGNLWGLCDTLGVVKVKPTFEKIENFAINKKFYGKYVVRKNNKISVIDQYKKILLNETEDYDSIFVTDSNRETTIFKNGKMGMLMNFKPFIPTEYDRINKKANGSYVVKIDELEGLINSKGQLIIPVEYKYVSRSYDKEDEKNKQFVWEAEGVFVNKKFYDDIYIPEASEEDILEPPALIGVQEARPPSDKIKEAKKRLLEKYDNVSFYENENLIFVDKDKKKGVLSYPDETVIFDIEYDDIDFIGHEKESAVFLLRKNGKSGILLKNKKIILPLEYDDITYEYDYGRYYVLKKNSKKGVFLLNTIYKPIQAKYKTIKQIPPIPVNENWQFGLFETETIDGKKGIVGENGVEFFKN